MRAAAAALASLLLVTLAGDARALGVCGVRRSPRDELPGADGDHGEEHGGEAPASREEPLAERAARVSRRVRGLSTDHCFIPDV